MSDRTAGIRSILSFPEVYRWTRDIVGLNRWLQRYVTAYVKPEPGDRILDIGCGTGEVVRYLRGSTYVGVDCHAPYIEYATRVFGDHGRFVQGNVADYIAEFEGQFDLVLANGVLHHLDDVLGQRVFQIAARVLRNCGRLVTVDPCFYDGQSPLTRFIVANDRGGYVRHYSDYPRMAQGAFRSVECSLWAGYFPIPFSVAIMQCQTGRESLT